MTDTDDKQKDTGFSAIDKELFESRTILLYGDIDHKLAKTVCAQLLALDNISHDPITIVLSSPGGHVESGDSIHDIIQFVKSDVRIIGSGWVASAGTHIFLSVPLEQRYCLPNTRFLIHQPSGSAGGKSSDIAIQAEQIVKMRERIARQIAEATGNSFDKVLKDIDRDYWMDTQAAIEYGLLSKVIRSKDDIA